MTVEESKDMKTVEELGLSQIPWKAHDYAFYILSKDGKTEVANHVFSERDIHVLEKAPDMYEQLRQSTNMIEHVIQFLGKVPEIQKVLRELAKKNRAVLGMAAGEK